MRHILSLSLSLTVIVFLSISEKSSSGVRQFVSGFIPVEDQKPQNIDTSQNTNEALFALNDALNSIQMSGFRNKKGLKAKGINLIYPRIPFYYNPSSLTLKTKIKPKKRILYPLQGFGGIQKSLFDENFLLNELNRVKSKKDFDVPVQISFENVEYIPMGSKQSKGYSTVEIDVNGKKFRKTSEISSNQGKENDYYYLILDKNLDTTLEDNLKSSLNPLNLELPVQGLSPILENLMKSSQNDFKTPKLIEKVESNSSPVKKTNLNLSLTMEEYNRCYLKGNSCHRCLESENSCFYCESSKECLPSHMFISASFFGSGCPISSVYYYNNCEMKAFVINFFVVMIIISIVTSIILLVWFLIVRRRNKKIYRKIQETEEKLLLE